MSLSDLMQDVIDRDEKGVIVDADSICYLSCYTFKDEGTIEEMYIDFWQRIKTIEAEIWKTYTISNVVISLTSSTNFRYELYPEYKLNRKKQDDTAKKLNESVKQLKKLIYDRLR